MLFADSPKFFLYFGEIKQEKYLASQFVKSCQSQKKLYKFSGQHQTYPAK